MLLRNDVQRRSGALHPYLLRLAGLIRRSREVLTRSDEAAVAQRASALALAIRLGSAGLAYIGQVVLARLMGQFEYGVFAYIWVCFIVTVAIATLGFGDSPLRFIPQLRERGEAAHVRGFIRFAGWTTVITSLSLATLIIAALPLLGHVFDKVYIAPMALMAVCLPFACLQSYLEAVGRCYNWTIPSLVPVYILRHGLLLLFLIAAVRLGYEASAVTGLVCLVLTLAASLVYQAATILLRLRRISEPGPAAYRRREWLRGSAPFSVLHGSAYLASFADVFVLSFFVSPAELAIYFAATRIIQVVNLVPSAAAVGTMHLFSAAHTRGDNANLQRLCRGVALATFAIAVLALATILVCGDVLLSMFGPGFEAGYPALIVLAAGLVVRVAAGPVEEVLNMTGYGALSASSYLAMMVVSIALNIVLIGSFGIIGAAIATSCVLVARVLWLTYAVHRVLGIRASVFALPFHRTARALEQPAE